MPDPDRAPSGDACPPVQPAGCRLCGTVLPPPAEVAPDPGAAASGGLALVECPGCGEAQVYAGGASLCDGESLALRHALEYLARRRARER